MASPWKFSSGAGGGEKEDGAPLLAGDDHFDGNGAGAGDQDGGKQGDLDGPTKTCAAKCARCCGVFCVMLWTFLAFLILGYVCYYGVQHAIVSFAKKAGKEGMDAQQANVCAVVELFSRAISILAVMWAGSLIPIILFGGCQAAKTAGTGKTPAGVGGGMPDPDAMTGLGMMKDHRMGHDEWSPLCSWNGMRCIASISSIAALCVLGFWIYLTVVVPEPWKETSKAWECNEPFGYQTRVYWFAGLAIPVLMALSCCGACVHGCCRAAKEAASKAAAGATDADV